MRPRRNQRQHKKKLSGFTPDLTIVERMYQIKVIKRVSERVTNKHRQALLV